MQPAGRGPNLRAAIRAEEVGDGRLFGVQFAVRLPAVAREDAPFIVDRIELWQKVPRWLQHWFTSENLLFAHHRPPLATKGARKRVREDANHGGCRTLSTALHPLRDVA